MFQRKDEIAQSVPNTISKVKCKLKDTLQNQSKTSGLEN